MTLNDDGLELKDGLDSIFARPARQVGQANVVQIVHASLRKGDPRLLKIGRKGEEDVLGNALEFDDRLHLGSGDWVEGRRRRKAVPIESLDGQLLEMKRRVEIEAEVDRIELGESLDDGRPPLSKLADGVDDDSNLEKSTDLVGPDEGSAVVESSAVSGEEAKRHARVLVLESAVVRATLRRVAAKHARSGIGEVGLGDDRCGEVVDLRPLRSAGASQELARRRAEASNSRAPFQCRDREAAGVDSGNDRVDALLQFKADEPLEVSSRESALLEGADNLHDKRRELSASHHQSVELTGLRDR